MLKLLTTSGLWGLLNLPYAMRFLRMYEPNLSRRFALSVEVICDAYCHPGFNRSETLEANLYLLSLHLGGRIGNAGGRPASVILRKLGYVREDRLFTPPPRAVYSFRGPPKPSKPPNAADITDDPEEAYEAEAAGRQL